VGTLLKIPDAANIRQRSLLVLARDRTIALAHDLPGAADPTLHGARVRVWSDAVFEASYDLPAGGWRIIGTSKRPRGYRYDDRRGVAGPVRSVVVKDGVMLKITARSIPDVSLAMALSRVRRDREVQQRSELRREERPARAVPVTC
jgi:hypothetical protein